jgi:hypothetical protein
MGRTILGLLEVLLTVVISSISFPNLSKIIKYASRVTVMFSSIRIVLKIFRKNLQIFNSMEDT